MDLFASLTDLVGEFGIRKTKKSKGTKKALCHWDDIHQRVSRAVIAVVARDMVLAYPDFSKEFVVYTDASKRQLRSVITQNNRPIAFFIRKVRQIK